MLWFELFLGFHKRLLHALKFLACDSCESTAHLLKKQYLAELNNQCQNSVMIPEVTSLPDVWHSENHWSNEATTMRYTDKGLFLFVKKKGSHGP